VSANPAIVPMRCPTKFNRVKFFLGIWSQLSITEGVQPARFERAQRYAVFAGTDVEGGSVCLPSREIQTGASDARPQSGGSFRKSIRALRQGWSRVPATLAIEIPNNLSHDLLPVILVKLSDLLFEV
jgi:hypothetical protein